MFLQDYAEDGGDKVSHLREETTEKTAARNRNADSSECWKGFVLRTCRTETVKRRYESEQQKQKNHQGNKEKLQQLQLEDSSAKGDRFVYKFMKDLLRLKRKLILRAQDNSNHKQAINKQKNATLRRTLLRIGGRQGSSRLKEEDDLEDEHRKYIEVSNYFLMFPRWINFLFVF